jgi:hypothetical protein
VYFDNVKCSKKTTTKLIQHTYITETKNTKNIPKNKYFYLPNLDFKRTNITEKILSGFMMIIEHFLK